jgi:chromosome segregation ATPase
MNPVTLREWVDRIYDESYEDGVGFCLMAEEREFVYAAADAWEDIEKRFAEEVEWDNKRADKILTELEEKYDEVRDLRKRLETAEKQMQAMAHAMRLGAERLETAERDFDVIREHLHDEIDDLRTRLETAEKPPIFQCTLARRKS